MTIQRLRDVGQLASVWVEAQDAVLTLGRDVSRRERDRDDLRFQVAQLKGRLGTMSAEGDIDLDALRETTRRIDTEIQELLDRIAKQCTKVVEHFLGYPDLRDAVMAAQR